MARGVVADAGLDGSGGGPGVGTECPYDWPMGQGIREGRSQDADFSTEWWLYPACEDGPRNAKSSTSIVHRGTAVNELAQERGCCKELACREGWECSSS